MHHRYLYLSSKRLTFGNDLCGFRPKCTGTLSLAGVGRRGPRYSAAVDQAPPQRSAARAFPLHRPLIALGIRGPQGRRGQGRNRKPQPEAKRRDRVRISARSAALDRRSRAGGHRSPVLGGEWSVQPPRAVDYSQHQSPPCTVFRVRKWSAERSCVRHAQGRPWPVPKG